MKLQNLVVYAVTAFVVCLLDIRTGCMAQGTGRRRVGMNQGQFRRVGVFNSRPISNRGASGRIRVIPSATGRRGFTRTQGAGRVRFGRTMPRTTLPRRPVRRESGQTSAWRQRQRQQRQPFRQTFRMGLNPRSGVTLSSSGNLGNFRRLIRIRPNNAQNCRPPRAIYCEPWPSNRDPRNAQRCNGNCPGRTCRVPCQCTCTVRNTRGSTRTSSSSQTSRRNPNQTRPSGKSSSNTQNPNPSRSGKSHSQQPRSGTPHSQQPRSGTSHSQHPVTSPAATNSPSPSPSPTRTSVDQSQSIADPANNIQARQSSPLEFGINTSVLASLIAEPELNNLVGPQGINSILAGEPPALLPNLPDSLRGRGVNIAAQLLRNRQTSLPEERLGNMGIPVPLDGLSFGEGIGNILGGGDSLFGELGGNDMDRAALLRSAISAVDAVAAPSVGMMQAAPLGKSANVQPTEPTNTANSSGVLINHSLIRSGKVKPVAGKIQTVQSPKGHVDTLSNINQAINKKIKQIDVVSDLLAGRKVDKSAMREAGLTMDMIFDGLVGMNQRGAGQPDISALTSGMAGNDAPFISGGQEASDATMMASMMQSMGGAVDAVGAANMKNKEISDLDMLAAALSMAPPPPIDVIPHTNQANSKHSSTASSGNHGNKMVKRSSKSGSMQNFLKGTVKATDPGMTGPTSDECLSKNKELWCDPVGVWDGTPGVARWCMQNCGANNCDSGRCTCACVNKTVFKAKFDRLGVRAP